MKADSVTEKEVMDILNKFVEFYSKHDMEGLKSLVAPDSNVTVIGAGMDEKDVGFSEIKKQFERIWSQFKSASIELKWISISASGSVAWIAMDTRYKVKVEGHNLIFSCYVTTILEKHGDKWFFVHVHHSVPAAELPHAYAKKHLSHLGIDQRPSKIELF